MVRQESSQGGAGRPGAGILERLVAPSLQYGASTKGVFYNRIASPLAAANPFTTRQEANTASLKEPGTIAVQNDNGGWLLAPRVRAYSEKELENATNAITDINPLLARAGVAPAQVLSDTPSAELACGRSIGRTLGYEVIFIKENPDFDGVAIGGKAFVSPNEEHPEVAVIAHEVLHVLKQSDKATVKARTCQP